MCAKYATHPWSPVLVASDHTQESNWIPIQYNKNCFAPTKNICPQERLSIFTQACGNMSKYAPSTPEMAPDAPRFGIVTDGHIIICKKSAPNPAKR